MAESRAAKRFSNTDQETNGLAEELGRGSFGIVYKGTIVINDSENILAVKKLDRVTEDSENEFKAEVDIIGRTHHKNLIRLIGFCNEGQHRLLAYEYMPNGTLAAALFVGAKPSWKQRTQMATGVAKGLLYLHEECTTQIIHCDIKPQNILLDDRYNARISDFGLAKLLRKNQSKTLTNIRGTKGYVAPEWFRSSQVTAKVDVYSFGVLLLEIITCRRSVDQNMEFTEEESPILVDWVWDCLAGGKVEIIVGNEAEALADRAALERLVKVGLWCVQEDVSVRPMMRTACLMMEGVIDVPVPPCPYNQISIKSQP
ncbi:G-type lectin S-receptor-like serine/threonine-protein kinase RLK1 [Andrographis paniculata]|uniref:G-type lectin S-receptor-like serine/threonine-protein kinase RLK1 n=1 Tax=Andrographis paniculata TaxID=175694 RepID=UPI0021E84FFA|nr:G-type lectin S-receptor-like serine/threonine-protein kinase RLK1 [Andrographis paniculata]